MTKERQNIDKDFYSGNTKDITVSVVDADGNKFDLTSAEIHYAIFHEKTGQIYLRKSSLDGEITITPPATDGVLVIHLLPNDTANMHGTFRHHVNVIDQYGDEYTVTTGTINIFEAFARRIRTSLRHAYLAGRVV